MVTKNMNDGIVFIGENKQEELRTKNNNVEFVLYDNLPPTLPFDKNLIVFSGIAVPWHLIDAAFNILEKYNALFVCGEYTELLSKYTNDEKFFGDLRIPTYCDDMFFINRSEWNKIEKPLNRINIMRYIFTHQPLFYPLPNGWRKTHYTGNSRIRRIPKNSNFIRLDIGNNQYVKVHVDQKEQAIELLKNRGIHVIE